MDRERYLKELEDEHREIERLFGDLKGVLEGGDVEDMKALRETLISLRALLIDHVRNEDDVFYSDLRRHAVLMEQDALIPALDLYMDTMHRISREAIEFFDKHITDDHLVLEDVEMFIEGLRTLRDEIFKRIKSEERSLFYIYRAYFLDHTVVFES